MTKKASRRPQVYSLLEVSNYVYGSNEKLPHLDLTFNLNLGQ